MFLYALMSLFIASALSQSCSNLDSCSDCLSMNGCGWCISESTGRCVREASDLSTCDTVINPHSRIDSIGSQVLDQLTQVSIDSVDITLRVGEPVTFNFTVKAAENYPLDLYILMDLSYTYNNDLEQVKILAPSLADSLQNLSTDSLIGFGTFVDKQSPPFASRRQLDLLFTDLNGNPSCRKNDECSLPIAYEHVSDLTNSSDIFNEAIQELVISTSADGPEGTLDAMMQAAVCTELVGWRENSRKVMMVMTDDVVHSAGDGRVAGITRINDAQCHTEYSEQYDKYLYTASTEYDYPSFEQLRLVLRENAIVPVFAVPTSFENYLQIYFEKVADATSGFVAVSAGTDSSDLIEVIAEAYNDVVSQVSVDYDSPSFIQSSIQFTCPPTDNPTLSNERCTNIGNDEVQVSITLTLTECVPDISNGKGYSSEVIVPGFDKFTVNIKGECSCDCDGISETNVTRCVNGELRCGKCYCDNGWKGDKCDCSLMACPSFNGQECGGRGTCDGCGTCICNEFNSPQNGVDNPLIFGDSCECSNYECETDTNGKVCSDRGTCECSNGVHRCTCSPSEISGNFSYGDICQCTTDYCIDPSNSRSNMVCSGNGTCENPCAGQGQGCKCNEGCSGDYCQNCIDFSVDYCPSVDDACVECYGEAIQANEDPTKSCDTTLICDSYIALQEEQPSDYTIPGTIRPQDCSISTTECNYVYYVGVNATTQALIYAVEPRSCLLLPIWAISVIIVIGLLIIGIIIIATIKVCLMWMDYREYKRFMYDVNSANKTLQSNPVYQDPITHVDNPVHGKPM